MAIPDVGTSTIDNAFVEAFKSNVVMLSQQKPSKLRPCVSEMTVKGELANVERLGAVEAVEKTTRHTPTPVLDAPHSRRKFGMSDFQWADLIDQEDQLRILISPKSEYAQAGAWAMNRQYDNLIIAAMGGNATDGDGASVALPAGQKVTAAGAMDMDAVLAAKQVLDENEVDSSDRFMVCSAADMMAMLGTTEVASSDFNTVKSLVRGEFSTWLGFTWIQTELLPDNKAYAWHKSGMRLGVGRDVVTRIDARLDVSYATQVYLAFTAGATRVEDEKVVEITTS
jgi:hypothetical protein